MTLSSDMAASRHSVFYDHATISELVDHAEQTGLVLFLGAGVTASFLPTWVQLLHELLEAAVRWRFSFDERSQLVRDLIQWAKADDLLPYQQAAIVKRLFGTQYLIRLRRALYRQRSVTEPKRDLLDSVVTLCRNETVVAVVSYNFDDYLVESLRKDNRRRVRVVCGSSEEGFPIRPDDRRKLGPFLHLFHIHGYIPRREHPPLEDESALVFSQDEYFQNMLTPFSWQTTTQLHFLRNYTALFIGTSLNDVNMARMLHHAKGSGPRFPKYATFAARDLLPKEECELSKPDWQLTAAQKAKIRMRATVLDDLAVQLLCTGLDWPTVAGFVDDVSCCIESRRKAASGNHA